MTATLFRSLLGLLLGLTFATAASAQVVINEVYLSPPGGVTTNNMYNVCQSYVASTQEWIEVYNTSACDTVDISCWVLFSNSGNIPFICGNNEGAATDENYGVFVFPQGTRLPPRAHFTVGGTTQNGRPDFLLQDLGSSPLFCATLRWFLQNQRGWIGLLDANFRSVDGVYWGNAGMNDGPEIISGTSAELNQSFGRQTASACNCARQNRNLPSARQLANTGVMNWAGNYFSQMADFENRNRAQFARVPDGGAWQEAPDFNASPGRCNGPCVTGSNLVDLTPAERTICQGALAQLVSLPRSGIDAAKLRYHWSSIPAGFSAPDDRQFQVEIRPAQTTRYVLRTVFGACTDFDTVLVNVRPIPGSNYEIAPNPVCLGAQASLRLISDAVDGAFYTWEMSDGNRFTGPGPHAFTPRAAGPLTVTLRIDNQGCAADPTIRNFTVIDRPTADFSLEPAVICTGEATRLTFRGRASVNASFSWYFDGANAVPGTGRGPHDLRWATAGTKNISLVVREGGSCPSDSVVRTVEVRRSNPSSFRVEPQQVCINTPVTVTYEGGSDPEATFRWEFFDAQVEGAGEGPGPHVLRWATEGRRVVRLTVNSPTCPGEPTTREIQVDPGLPFSLTLTDSIICTGDAVRVNYVGEQRTGRVFDWDFTDAEVVPLGGASGPYELRWNTAGDRGVRLRVSDPGSTCPPGERGVLIRVLDRPVADFSLDLDDICLDQTSRLTYTGDLPPDVTLDWDFGAAVPVQVSTDPPRYDLRWTQPGTYTVSVTVRAGNCASAPVSRTVRVRNRARASFTVDKTTICSGESLNLTFDGEATNEAQYGWGFGGANAVPGTGTGPHVLTWPAGQTGVRTLSLNLTDRDADRCPAAPFSLEVEIIPRPEALFTLLPEGPLCADDTATVRYTGATSSDLEFIWDFGGARAIPGTGEGPHTLVWGRAGTGTVKLTVDRRGCRSSEEEESIELLPAPDARFVLAPDTLCAGGSATARILNAPDPAALVQWQLGGLAPFLTDSTAQVLDFAALTAGVWPLRLEIALGGCTGRRADTLLVVAPPVVEIDGPDQLCAGETAQFRAAGTYETFARFEWRVEGGTALSPVTGEVVSVRWNEAGNHTVSLRIIHLEDCFAESNKEVFVNERLEAAFRIEPLEACEGDTVRLVPDASLPETADLTWRLPVEAALVDSEDLRSPYVRWLRGGRPTVRLEARTQGCPPDTAELAAIVRSRPVARFSLEPRLLCPDETSVQLFTGEAGPTAEFDWGDLAGAAVSPIPGPGNRLSWPAPGPRVLTLTVRDSGCVSAPFVDSLRVNPKPSISLELSPEVLCPNQQAFAEAASDLGELYLWDFAGAAAEPGDESAGPHVLRWSALGRYEVSVRAVAAGCTSDVARRTAAMIEPEVDFRMDSVACMGEAVRIELLSPWVPGARYEWNSGGAATFRETAQGRWQASWASAGPRTVRLRLVLDGCESQEVERTTLIYPRPEAAITSEPKRGQSPLRVQFRNETTPPDVGHRWDFGDGRTGNARNPFHLYRRAGTYHVMYEAISAGGCRDTVRDTITVDPLEIFIPNAFSPNGDGVNDRFVILNLEGLEDVQVRIYDRWGVLIFETRNPSEHWDGTKNGTPVQEGVYVYRIDLREPEGGDRLTRAGSVTLLR